MTVAHAVDIQDFINARRFSKFQWLIFSMCFVIVLLDGFDTASIGFIAPSLLGEWHLTKPSLAPVLSAALFGLAFGAIVAGPLSDRLGRRKLLIGSVAIFGVACLISAFAGDLSQLTILRFITGIGLGAAMPNAVTMMSEYCPDSRRSTLTNLMFCGFPLGAALGGFLAAWIIPHYGWRSVLVLGGLVPLALLLVMALLCPNPSASWCCVRNPRRRSAPRCGAFRRMRMRSMTSRWARRLPRITAMGSVSYCPVRTSSAPSCCGSPISWGS